MSPTESPYAARPWLRYYDYWVPPTQTYPERALHEILDAVVVDLPDRPATSFLGATLTFSEIKDRSDRLAVALASGGLAQGDRVGIMLPNCPQYIIAAFAILRCGGIVVNINPTYTARELLTVAKDSGMRALVTLDQLAPLAKAIKGNCSLERVIVTSLAEYSLTPAATPRVDDAEAMTNLIEQTPRSVVRVPISADDVAVLQYTGGTTGTPKGAMLTHRNIFSNLVQTESFMYRARLRGEARYLLVIPYFHIYAFTVGMMKGLWVGALQILLPKYDPEMMLAAIREFRPTYVPAVPTLFVSLLNHPKVLQSGLDLVRSFNTGGAPCPVEVIEQFEKTIGRPLNEGYGLSETSPTTHSTPQFGRRKRGTVGVPLPDTLMKIVDVETGDREMPVGESGELCVSGPQVMKGYWQKPEESERVLRRGADGRIWFYTGDIAFMDEDGFTTIVQRKKDLIITSGFNVYPSEVETVLYMHPAIRLAAVIGVPDAYHGELVRACVVLKEGANVSPEELLAHCKTELAPFKVPKQVVFRDTLPMSAVGKILYRVLRDELEQERKS